MQFFKLKFSLRKNNNFASKSSSTKFTTNPKAIYTYELKHFDMKIFVDIEEAFIYPYHFSSAYLLAFECKDSNHLLQF